MVTVSKNFSSEKVVSSELVLFDAGDTSFGPGLKQMLVAEVVAITGGSGFLAQHLVAYLQRNASECIAEIRIIDRVEYKKILDYPLTIPIKSFKLDICEREKLRKSLSSCTTVFHCAGKQLHYFHSDDDIELEYIHDNINATEAVVDVMIDLKLRNLIYISDAYAHLPTGDNYGHSEYTHINIPDDFMLGAYGESKVRAECYAMKAAQRNTINSIILRPAFIYGEGEMHLTSAALKLCQNYLEFPYIYGHNRGNHQYIYAGNMAAIMVRCMHCLNEDPSKYNSEHIYCIDATPCIPFRDFIMPYVQAKNFQAIRKLSYFQAYSFVLFFHFISKINAKYCQNQLTLTSFQFISGNEFFVKKCLYSLKKISLNTANFLIHS